MTKEDAWRKAKGYLYDALTGDEADEIIKALEQPCEDTISRAYIEPIVEELANICVNGDDHILDLLADIKNAPPVTPQPATSQQKVGRWINGDDICPCCGKSKFEGLDADIWADWQPKHCPNCGAKMEV